MGVLEKAQELKIGSSWSLKRSSSCRVPNTAAAVSLNSLDAEIGDCLTVSRTAGEAERALFIYLLSPRVDKHGGGHDAG